MDNVLDFPSDPRERLSDTLAKAGIEVSPEEFEGLHAVCEGMLKENASLVDRFEEDEIGQAEYSAALDDLSRRFVRRVAGIIGPGRLRAYFDNVEIDPVIDDEVNLLTERA